MFAELDSSWALCRPQSGHGLSLCLESNPPAYSRDTQVLFARCYLSFLLKLLHIVVRGGESPLLLHEHRRGEKDGTEGLQLPQRSYDWWDRTAITDSGCQRRFWRKLHNQTLPVSEVAAQEIR